MRTTTLRPIIACCFLLWIFWGCTPGSLKPARYVAYIRDPEHGFVDRQEVGGMFLEACFQPPAYAALMQITPAQLSDSLFRSEMDREASFYHFTLALGADASVPIDEMLKKTIPGEASFEKKKQNMLYGIQNNFVLVIGQDSLPCVFYHAQPSGKIDNAYHFILAFESDPATVVGKSDENLTLVYTDSIWLQKRMEFVFDRKKINQSPSLKL